MGGTCTPFIRYGVSGQGFVVVSNDAVSFMHFSKEPVPTIRWGLLRWAVAGLVELTGASVSLRTRWSSSSSP
jgi:hypothetical protein